MRPDVILSKGFVIFVDFGKCKNVDFHVFSLFEVRYLVGDSFFRTFLLIYKDISASRNHYFDQNMKCAFFAKILKKITFFEEICQNWEKNRKVVKCTRILYFYNSEYFTQNGSLALANQKFPKHKTRIVQILHSTQPNVHFL